MDSAIPINLLASADIPPPPPANTPPSVPKPKPSSGRKIKVTTTTELPANDSLIEESQRLFGTTSTSDITSVSESKSHCDDERKQLSSQIKAVCDAKNVKPCDPKYIQPSSAVRLKTQKLRDELNRVTNLQSESVIISSSDNVSGTSIDSESVDSPDGDPVDDSPDDSPDDVMVFEEPSELNPIFKDHVPLFLHKVHKSFGLVLECVTRNTAERTGVSLEGFSDAIDRNQDSFFPMYLAILEEHQRNNVVKQLCTPTMSFALMNVGIASEVIAANKAKTKSK